MGKRRKRRRPKSKLERRMTSHQNQFNGPRQDPNHTLLLSISSDKQLSI
jgi:transcription elongation factor Elf1